MLQENPTNAEEKKASGRGKVLLLTLFPFLSFVILITVLLSILSIGSTLTIIVVLLIAFAIYLCGVILYFSMAEKKSFLQTIRAFWRRS